MVLIAQVVDAFSELGLTPDTPHDVAKSTYKKLALAHHPDRNHGDSTATERFQKIGAAWHICQRHYERPDLSEVPDPTAKRSYQPYNGAHYNSDDDVPIDEYDAADFFRFMFEEMLFNRFSYARGQRYRRQRHGDYGSGLHTFSSSFADSQTRQESNSARQKKERDAYLQRVKELEAEIVAEKREKARIEREQAKMREQQVKAYQRAFFAGRAGDVAAMISVIEEYDLDVNAPEAKRKQGTPVESMLHVAARSCDEGLLAFLLQRGANLAAVSKDSLMPFHVAILSGNTRAVTWFLERHRIKPIEGCHPSKASPEGRTPLQLALVSGVPDMVRLVLKDATVHDVAKSWEQVEKQLQCAAEGSETTRLQEIRAILLTKNGFSPDEQGRSKKALRKLAEAKEAAEKARMVAEEKERAEKKRAEKEAKRLVQEEQEKREAEEEARRAAQDAQRLVEENNRLAQEESRRLAQEEAHRRAQEARRLAQEEARRLAQEEARRLAQEEARRLAQEEARRLAQEEARRLVQEEARRLVQEETHRLTQEETYRLAEAETRRRAEAEAEVDRQEEEKAQRYAEAARRRAAEKERKREAIAAAQALRKLEESETERQEDEERALPEASGYKKPTFIEAAQEAERQEREEESRLLQESLAAAAKLKEEGIMRKRAEQSARDKARYQRIKQEKKEKERAKLKALESSTNLPFTFPTANGKVKRNNAPVHHHEPRVLSVYSRASSSNLLTVTAPLSPTHSKITVPPSPPRTSRTLYPGYSGLDVQTRAIPDDLFAPERPQAPHAWEDHTHARRQGDNQNGTTWRRRVDSAIGQPSALPLADSASYSSTRGRGRGFGRWRGRGRGRGRGKDDGGGERAP